jgi:rhamnosyltransferase
MKLNTSICAAVVSYNPDEALETNLRALAQQIPHIVVIDNGSDAQRQARIAAAVQAVGAHFIGNAENRGVAAALNQAADYATTSGYAWLATFDQDSLIPEGMIENLLAAHAAWPQRERVAVIAPIHLDVQTGNLMGKPVRDEPQASREVVAAITSGSLIRLDIWQAIGGFDEGLFIDAVDTDYCLRCRKHRYAILEVRAVRLLHSLGASRRESVGPLRFTTTHHRPIRVYYMTRNALVMWGRWGLQEPRWVLDDGIEMAKKFVKILLAERDKGKKLFAAACGVAHALGGVRGRAPRRLNS